MKKYVAEAIGTFALVFCGTGSIIINDITDGAISHVGVALTFGLIVMVMIYAFGNISGAHLNPAVTIGFSFTKVFQKSKLGGYLLAQAIGAFLASGVLRMLFEHENLGATLPCGSWQQSFVLEIILTYFLMLVILFVSQDKNTASFTAVAVGATVMLEALFAGPITGASMNPIRSIAPAIMSNNLATLWVYILAPTIGALLATWTWHFLRVENE